MQKYSELSVEIAVNKVSCPGVWLCQQGKVSLTLFALGTSYQTILAPPLFPIVFKEVFHFKKTFQKSCAFQNVPCLLKDESLYCELVQWSGDCRADACAVLAQYLGSLGDVLFPPSVCWCDGVDLLMRRTEHFPGILAPKIEISTTVRLDEVWRREARGRPLAVCHSPLYHRRHHDPFKKFRSKSSDSRLCNVKCRNFVCGPSAAPAAAEAWVRAARARPGPTDGERPDASSPPDSPAPTTLLLESKYLRPETSERAERRVRPASRAPCDCAICRRYQQLFHSDMD